MHKTLTGSVIAVTGDFGASRSHTNLKRWIEAHNGTFAKTIHAGVTHLICSKEHWKSKTVTVKEALAHKIIIVDYNWLEDSLQAGRRKAPQAYLLKNVCKVAAKEKASQRQRLKPLLKQEGTTQPTPETSSPVVEHSVVKTLTATMQTEESKSAEKFLKGCEEAKRDILFDDYHTYRDSTAFCYRITLTRPNIVENKNERFLLHLFESNTIPYRYALTATYTHPNTLPKIFQLVRAGADFRAAYTAWRAFFLSRTGVAWDQRIWWAKKHQTLESRARAITPSHLTRSENEANNVEIVEVGQVVEAPSSSGVKRVDFAYRKATTQPRPNSTFYTYRLPVPTCVEGTQERDIVSGSLGEIGQTQELRDLIRAAQVKKNEIYGKFVGGGKMVGMSGAEEEIEGTKTFAKA